VVWVSSSDNEWGNATRDRMIDKVTSSPSTILNWIVSTLEAASGTAMLNGVVIDYCRLRRNPPPRRLDCLSRKRRTCSSKAPTNNTVFKIIQYETIRYDEKLTVSTTLLYWMLVFLKRLVRVLNNTNSTVHGGFVCSSVTCNLLCL